MTGINTRALDRELRPSGPSSHAPAASSRSRSIPSYPLLNRLEERSWIRGAWVEKPEERRRRSYKVTAEGRRVLAEQRQTWEAFVEAVRLVTGAEHA